jgi:hypothetical protein
MLRKQRRCAIDDTLLQYPEREKEPIYRIALLNVTNNFEYIMRNQNYFGIIFAGLLILLLFTIATAGAQYVAVTITTPTPPQTLGTTPPTPPQTLGTTPPTPPQTLGTTPPTGKGIPLSPAISVLAIAGAALILLHKRK